MISFDADALHAALSDKLAQLRAELEGRIKDNLSGKVLQRRSGALLASIVTDVAEDETGFTVSAASVGVAYAAIQEYGGKTQAQEIVALKGRALAFASGAGTVFATRVHHPGSSIPARSYLGSALDDIRHEITGGLKQTVLDSLQA